MIKINREKAESIVLNSLRTERAPRLEELDVQFMRAVEEGADTEQIVLMKIELRDVTRKDLSSLSIEELATLDLDAAIALK